MCMTGRANWRTHLVIKVFLIFATLHGMPMGPTERVMPVTHDCRNEINMVKGINQYNFQEHTDIVLYGSCEWIKRS